MTSTFPSRNTSGRFAFNNNINREDCPQGENVLKGYMGSVDPVFNREFHRDTFARNEEAMNMVESFAVANLNSQIQEHLNGKQLAEQVSEDEIEQHLNSDLHGDAQGYYYQPHGSGRIPPNSDFRTTRNYIVGLEDWKPDLTKILPDLVEIQEGQIPKMKVMKFNKPDSADQNDLMTWIQTIPCGYDELEIVLTTIYVKPGYLDAQALRTQGKTVQSERSGHSFRLAHYPGFVQVDARTFKTPQGIVQFAFQVLLLSYYFETTRYLLVSIGLSRGINQRDAEKINENILPNGEEVGRLLEEYISFMLILNKTDRAYHLIRDRSNRKIKLGNGSTTAVTTMLLSKTSTAVTNINNRQLYDQSKQGNDAQIAKRDPNEAHDIKGDDRIIHIPEVPLIGHTRPFQPFEHILKTAEILSFPQPKKPNPKYGDAKLFVHVPNVHEIEIIGHESYKRSFRFGNNGRLVELTGINHKGDLNAFDFLYYGRGKDKDVYPIPGWFALEEKNWSESTMRAIAQIAEMNLAEKNPELRNLEDELNYWRDIGDWDQNNQTGRAIRVLKDESRGKGLDQLTDADFELKGIQNDIFGLYQVCKEINTTDLTSDAWRASQLSIARSPEEMKMRALGLEKNIHSLAQRLHQLLPNSLLWGFKTLWSDTDEYKAIPDKDKERMNTAGVIYLINMIYASIEYEVVGGGPKKITKDTRRFEAEDRTGPLAHSVAQVKTKNLKYTTATINPSSVKDYLGPFTLLRLGNDTKTLQEGARRVIKFAYQELSLVQRSYLLLLAFSPPDVQDLTRNHIQGFMPPVKSLHCFPGIDVLTHSVVRAARNAMPLFETEIDTNSYADQNNITVYEASTFMGTVPLWMENYDRIPHAGYIRVISGHGSKPIQNPKDWYIAFSSRKGTKDLTMSEHGDYFSILEPWGRESSPVMSLGVGFGGLGNVPASQIERYTLASARFLETRFKWAIQNLLEAIAGVDSNKIGYAATPAFRYWDEDEERYVIRGGPSFRPAIIDGPTAHAFQAGEPTWSSAPGAVTRVVTY